MTTLILALSNKILGLFTTFLKPSAIEERHRKKVIAYADNLSESLSVYITGKANTHSWAIVRVRLSQYKRIRKILK